MTAENPGTDRVELTRDDIHLIVREAVDETLIKIGMEPSQIGDMQRDFIFLRTLRSTHEQVKNKAILILVGTIITATTGMIVMGFRAMMGK